MATFVTPTPPLTTIFKPPASCTDVVTYDGENFWQGELFELGDLNCYPASFTYARNKFFSPGVCPEGWFSASSVAGTGALVTNPDESNALCCPTGYQAIEPSNGPTASGNTIFCGSLINSDLTNVYSTSTLDVGFLPDDYTASTITIDQADITVKPTVWAEVIQVRWQSTDSVIISLQKKQSSILSSVSSQLSEASKSSASPTASGPAITAPPTTAPATTAPATTAPADEDGLSAGEKAGIGIGAAALALLVIAGLVVLFRKRKKNRSLNSEVPLVPSAYKDYGDDNVIHPYQHPGELDAQSARTNHPPHVRQHAELAG